MRVEVRSICFAIDGMIAARVINIPLSTTSHVARVLSSKKENHWHGGSNQLDDGDGLAHARSRGEEPNEFIQSVGIGRASNLSSSRREDPGEQH